MQKSTKRLVVILVLALVLAAGLGISLLFLSVQRALKIELPPASVKAYQKLLAELRRSESVAGSETQDPARFAPFPPDSPDIIAGYARLFERVKPKVESFEKNDEDILTKVPAEWTPDEKSKVTEFLAANQDLIGDIREMAKRGGPVCALDFSKDYIDVSHLSHLRSCARVLRADAILNGMKGDYSGAVEDIIAGMRLGDALAQEPLLLSQLVRISLYETMNNAIQNSFNGADLSPELTSRLLTHVAQADRHEATSEALVGELSMMLGASRDPNRNPFARLTDADAKACYDIISRLIVAAGLPYHQAAPELDQIEKRIKELPKIAVFSRDLLPGVVVRVSLAQARHEAMLDLIQLGILVEQYKARTGSCPATLNAIAPGLGGTLPADPFTGKEYHYRLSDDGFILYSVGQNCKDDGGKHDLLNGDMVWGGERQPRTARSSPGIPVVPPPTR